MDEDWRPLAVGVKLDLRSFANEVQAMRASLEGPLEQGAERAGRRIEASLLRAVRTGKVGFDELKAAGLSAMDAIAAGALRAGLSALIGSRSSSGSGQAGLGGLLAGVIARATGSGQVLSTGSGQASGLPGRATGGPVAPARPYLVGERGPELFVPTAAGRIETATPAAAREVRVAITVNAAPGEAPEMLRRSGRQVARAVRAALEG